MTAVILVDPLKLRREAIRKLLQPWAEENHVSLAALAPDQISSLDLADVPVVLALLSIGGLAIGDQATLGWLHQIAASLPETPIAVIGDHDSPSDILAALQAGARAFLPTSTEPCLALHTLTFIIHGGSYFPPGALLGRGGPRGAGGGVGRVPGRSEAARSHPSGLTPTQQAILVHLQDGKPNKLIARLLGLRESTVKVHVRQIMRKLGAHNRTQAALASLETLAA